MTYDGRKAVTAAVANLREKGVRLRPDVAEVIERAAKQWGVQVTLSVNASVPRKRRRRR